MFPGLGGMNPKKMEGMMKQMGISQNEIPASKVTIEKENGSRLIIENPSVIKMNVQGSDMFQITGDEKEENPEVEISEEDIKQVMEKTGVSEEQAKEALENTGDLAEAILKLS